MSGGTGLAERHSLPTLAAVLVAVRDEVERIAGRPARRRSCTRSATSGQTNATDLPDPTKQHVLVIAIDGTNMSKVLADDGTPNTNFLDLMGTSTTSAPSIVGHTTISNPSWTAIFTGAWDNKTGVINNVYTPTTYDRWPTVFTQLENAYGDGDISTKAIADWDVTGAIAASGHRRRRGRLHTAGRRRRRLVANRYQGHAGNRRYSRDEAEGAPNFLVTYLVQVDEAGHLYGGDSPEYETAGIQNTDVTPV